MIKCHKCGGKPKNFLVNPKITNSALYFQEIIGYCNKCYYQDLYIKKND